MIRVKEFILVLQSNQPHSSSPSTKIIDFLLVEKYPNAPIPQILYRILGIFTI